jgi:hypothetical protein
MAAAVGERGPERGGDGGMRGSTGAPRFTPDGSASGAIRRSPFATVRRHAGHRPNPVPSPSPPSGGYPAAGTPDWKPTISIASANPSPA